MHPWVRRRRRAADPDPAALIAQPQGIQVLQVRPKAGGPEDRVRGGEAAIGLAHSAGLHCGEHGAAVQGAAGVGGPGIGGPAQTCVGDDAAGGLTGLRRGGDLLDGGPALHLGTEVLAMEHRLTTGVPEGGCHPGDLLQLLDRGDAAAYHRHPPSGEVLQGSVVPGVQLPAGEALLARVLRQQRVVPGAGGVDDRPRAPDDLIGPDLQLARSTPLSISILDAEHPDRTPDGQLHGSLVLGEVAGDGCAAGLHRIDGRLGHPRQIEDAVDRLHAQRFPAMLPGTAGSRLGIKHDEAEQAAALQVISGRESRLAGADHHDVGPVLFLHRCSWITAAQ